MITSELMVLHRSADPLRSVLRNLEGYAETADTLHRLKEELRRSQPPTGRDDLVERATRAFLDQKKNTSFVTEEAHEIEVSTGRFKARVGILDDVEVHLVTQLDRIVRSSTSTILQSLDASLQEAISEARTLDLDGVGDSSDAIHAGKVDEWRALSDIRERVLLLRNAQQQVMMSLSEVDFARRTIDGFAYFANYHALHPEWLAGARHVPASRSMDGGVKLATPPWPDDPGARFIWTVRHPEAVAWVPTIEQLRKAYDEAHAEAEAELHERLRDPDAEREARRKAQRADLLLRVELAKATPR